MSTEDTHGTPDKPKEAFRLIDFKHGEDDRGKFVLDEAAVEKMFITDELRDLHIAVISIAGKVREGKSLMMDIMLRYALQRYSKGDLNAAQTWMADENIPVEGFTDRNSPNRKTRGIMVWPELFVTKRTNGERIALLLVDTQGTMDPHTSINEWASIFALSAMMSSVVLYNIMSNITEQALENLEFFAAYGHMISPIVSEVTPYQDIVFLVRDFKYAEIYGYGIEGGEKYLTDQFDSFTSFQLLSWNEIQYIQEHIEVRRNIEKSFSQKYCCLLSDPGRIVSENKEFNGVLKPVNYGFKNDVKNFVQCILSPNRLSVRKIDGELMTVTRLFGNLRMWVRSVNELNYPEPRPIYLATSETDHYSAREAAMRHYNTLMIAAGCHKMDYMPEKRLIEIHEDAKDKCIEYYNRKPKMGDGDMITSIVREKLELAISKRYIEYYMQNQSKKLWDIVKVPMYCMIGFLLCILIQFSMTSGLLEVPYITYKLAWWLSWVSSIMFFLWFKDMFWPIVQGWWDHSPFRFIWYALVNFIKSIRLLWAFLSMMIHLATSVYKLTSGRP